MFALNNSVMPAPALAFAAKQFAKKTGEEILKHVVKDGKKIAKETIKEIKKDPRNVLTTIQSNIESSMSGYSNNISDQLQQTGISDASISIPSTMSGNFNKLVKKKPSLLAAASSMTRKSINPSNKSKFNVGSMNPFNKSKFNVGSMNPFNKAKFNVGSMNPFNKAKFNVGSMNPFKSTTSWNPFKNAKSWNPFKSMKSIIPTSLLSGLFNKPITDGTDGNDDKNTNFQFELLKDELEDKYSTKKTTVDVLLEKQKVSMMKTNKHSSVGMFGMIVLVYYMVEISKQSYLSWTTNHVAPIHDPATMSKIVWCVLMCCFGIYAIFQATHTATKTLATSLLSFMMVLAVVEYLSKKWYFFQPLTLRDLNGMRSSCLYSKYLLPNKPGFIHNGSCATTNTSNNFVQVKHSRPMNLSGRYTVDLSNNTATNDKHHSQVVMSSIQGVVLAVLYGIVYFV